MIVHTIIHLITAVVEYAVNVIAELTNDLTPSTQAPLVLAYVIDETEYRQYGSE